MPLASANSVELFYDEVGDPAAPAMLLIMGLGAQMTVWPEAFRRGLAEQGFRVVRFDNRDIGLSSKCEMGPPVDVQMAFMSAMSGNRVPAPYTLDDMARDAIGLLDALGVERAHVVGASMGGMIAQIMAAKHRQRVRSLVSIMSTSGDPRLPQSQPSAMAALTAPRPAASLREANIEFGIAVNRAIGSRTYRTPEAELRERVEQAFERSAYPHGVLRQLVAVIADGSRVDRLKTIATPTLVIHGDEDPLVPTEGGQDTARHIPGAVLKIISGMAHDLPAPLIKGLVEMIGAHCRAADAASAR